MALRGAREDIKDSECIHLTLQMTRACARHDVHVHQQEPCACIHHVLHAMAGASPVADAA